MSKRPRETVKTIWLDYANSAVGPAPTIRLLLNVIAWRMRKDGSGAFPGQSVLAERTGLARRTVIDNIQRAQDMGWLRVEKIPSRYGMRNQYFPAVPIDLLESNHQRRMRGVDELVANVLTGAADAPVQEMHGCSNRRGAGAAPVQELHIGGAGDAPVPVQELHPSCIGSSLEELPTEEEAREALPSPSADRFEESRATTPGPLTRLPATALDVLDELQHHGSRRGTARSLEAQFLYPDGEEGLGAPVVKGLDLEERVALVGRALVEFGATTDTWNSAHFSGFVRRLRSAPKPGTEAARVAAHPEPGTHRTLTPPRYEDPSEEGFEKADFRSILRANNVPVPSSEVGGA